MQMPTIAADSIGFFSRLSNPELFNIMRRLSMQDLNILRCTNKVFYFLSYSQASSRHALTREEVAVLQECAPSIQEIVYDILWENKIQGFVQKGMKRISHDLVQISDDVFLYTHQRKTVIVSTCEALTNRTVDCQMVVKSVTKVDEATDTLSLTLENKALLSHSRNTSTYVLDGLNRKGNYLNNASIKPDIIDKITIPILKKQLMGQEFKRLAHFNSSSEDIFIKVCNSGPELAYGRVFIVWFYPDKTIKVLTSCYQANERGDCSFWGEVMDYEKKGENVYLILNNHGRDFRVTFDWRKNEHKSSFSVWCTSIEAMSLEGPLVIANDSPYLVK